MVFDPQNPHVLFAAMWEGYRTPWTLNSGGDKDGLYRSNDDGASWKRVEGNGMPEGPLGRIGVGRFRRRFERRLRADRSEKRRPLPQRRRRHELDFNQRRSTASASALGISPMSGPTPRIRTRSTSPTPASSVRTMAARHSSASMPPTAIITVSGSIRTIPIASSTAMTAARPFRSTAARTGPPKGISRRRSSTT